MMLNCNGNKIKCCLKNMLIILCKNFPIYKQTGYWSGYWYVFIG